MLSMCVSMVWDISSSSHVSVCLQVHIWSFSVAHSLRHFIEVLTIRSPFESQSFTMPSTWRLSPTTMEKHHTIHLNYVAFKFPNQPSYSSIGEFNRAVTPRGTPLKNCTEATHLSRSIVKEIAQTCWTHTQCVSLFPGENCTFFHSSP